MKYKLIQLTNGTLFIIENFESYSHSANIVKLIKDCSQDNFWTERIEENIYDISFGTDHKIICEFDSFGDLPEEVALELL